MKFANGKSAITYWAERKGHYSFENPMMLKITTNHGAALGIDSNPYAGDTPPWADSIETVTDIEKVIKEKLSAEDAALIMGWALNGPLHEEVERDDPEELRKNRISYDKQLWRAFKRFGAALKEYDYLLTRECVIAKNFS